LILLGTDSLISLNLAFPLVYLVKAQKQDDVLYSLPSELINVDFFVRNPSSIVHDTIQLATMSAANGKIHILGVVNDKIHILGVVNDKIHILGVLHHKPIFITHNLGVKTRQVLVI
jgi:hypothetical protein